MSRRFCSTKMLIVVGLVVLTSGARGRADTPADLAGIGYCAPHLNYSSHAWADLDGDGCITLVDYQNWRASHRLAGGEAFLQPELDPNPRNGPADDLSVRSPDISVTWSPSSCLTIEVGEDVQLSIYADIPEAEGIVAWGLDLYYNEAVTAVTDITYGPLWAEILHDPTAQDLLDGVDYNMGAMCWYPPPNGIWGNVLLATLTFTGNGVGTTQLVLGAHNPPDLLEGFAANPPPVAFIPFTATEGCITVCLLDSDDDGVCDADDNCPTIYNPTQANADGDAAGDACDGCPSDPYKIAPGVCGCGIADTDTDGDGLADCIDPCPARKPGDVSGNGLGDVGDIQDFVAVLLDPMGAAPDDLCATDVDDSGTPDGQDVQVFVGLLLAP